MEGWRVAQWQRVQRQDLNNRETVFRALVTSHTVNLLFILCPGWRKKGSLITEVADQRAFGFYSRTCPLLVCDGVNNNLFIVSDEGCMRTGRMKTESPHSLPHHWASCQGRYLDGEQLFSGFVACVCGWEYRAVLQVRYTGLTDLLTFSVFCSLIITGAS